MFTLYDRDFPSVKHETEIQWTHWPGYIGACWNMVRGCSRVMAPGAEQSGCGDRTGGGCYAERDGWRWAGEGLAYEGLIRLTAHGPRWTGEVRTIPNRLDEPLRRSKPRVFFVASTSDLFHARVLEEIRAHVLANMILCPWHVYISFTKRADEQERYLSDPRTIVAVRDNLIARSREPSGPWPPSICVNASAAIDDLASGARMKLWPPLSAIWGVSCENQPAFDDRAPRLERTPAWRRAWSLEPLLSPITPTPEQLRAVDWILVGGESGGDARPFPTSALYPLLIAVGLLGEGRPGVCVKQFGRRPLDLHGAEMGLATSHGGNPWEWPAWARVRELPRAVEHMIPEKLRAYAAPHLRAAFMGGE